MPALKKCLPPPRFHPPPSPHITKGLDTGHLPPPFNALLAPSACTAHMRGVGGRGSPMGPKVAGSEVDHLGCSNTHPHLTHISPCRFPKSLEMDNFSMGMACRGVRGNARGGGLFLKQAKRARKGLGEGYQGKGGLQAGMPEEMLGGVHVSRASKASEEGFWGV